MIRKDLNSQNQYDAGLALSALACFISADLARDLANDIMMLVSFFFLFSVKIIEMLLNIWVFLCGTGFDRFCTFSSTKLVKEIHFTMKSLKNYIIHR